MGKLLNGYFDARIITYFVEVKKMAFPETLSKE
jgi:hypothetical protein